MQPRREGERGREGECVRARPDQRLVGFWEPRVRMWLAGLGASSRWCSPTAELGASTCSTTSRGREPRLLPSIQTSSCSQDSDSICACGSQLPDLTVESRVGAAAAGMVAPLTNDVGSLEHQAFILHGGSKSRASYNPDHRRRQPGLGDRQSLGVGRVPRQPLHSPLALPEIRWASLSVLG